MNTARLRSFTRQNPYLFALILLVVALIVNYLLQPNLFTLRVLNGNLRVFLPLMILAVGQTIVILGGGIDISIGAIVSIVNAILVTQLSAESTPTQVALVILLSIGAGAAAGALNGFFTAYLRLQPIITTYATGFLFGGVALFILPQPGGSIPSDISRFYRLTTPLNIPLAIYVIVLILILWKYIRSLRYGRYLYAVGGQAESAFASAVPVTWMRFSTYVLAGVMAAFAGLALTLNTGAGDPRIGNAMTLDSITAVVLGGTGLSGGSGGVAGSIIGVAILGLIRNIISFANVPSWWRTLIDALIIVFALATPGLINLIRRKPYERRPAEAPRA